MNEELINQIVSRILSEPAFQALLHGNKGGYPEERKAVKPDGLVLLNYVPDFECVLTALKQCYGSDYTLSILPSDQANVSKPTLPEGMTWITPQEALEKTTWQKILVPACSPNTLAKAALGIRDNPISELIGRGITQGLPTLLVTEYLGFTEQTPKAYLQLYEGYLQTVQSYGVTVNATLIDQETALSAQVQVQGVIPAGSQPKRTSLYATEQRLASSEHRAASTEQNDTFNNQSELIREEIRYVKKFLGDKQTYDIPEGSKLLVKRWTVISPLARDTLKSRRIELCVEREDERQ